MSGIAAIIRLDGRPIEQGAIDHITAAMSYRGPDGIAHWRRGPVALGHCMLHTTTESLDEVQPLANEDESVVLIMDGWLSNPDELRGNLARRGARLRTRSDAELVLRAYEEWGEACPVHIDGEFALVVWDQRRGEAFVAGDHVGLKPLHYHWDGQQLVVASDIVGVLAGPGIEEVPNKGRIAEFLAWDHMSRDETIWQGVMRAKPAHWMRFSKAGMKTGRYWAPPIEVSIRYPHDQDYFDHYRDVFTDAVRRSSRSHRPISCDVSGGRDSSAIFAMAHELRRTGKLQAPGVEGYTYCFPNAAGEPHDEVEYARAVAAHVGERVQEIAPFLPDFDWFFERGKADRTIAGFPNGAMSIAIGSKLVADGSRVSLNGEGGDEWAGGNRFYYWEHIDERDWAGLIRSLRRDSAAFGKWQSARMLWRNGFAHHLPERLIAARRRVLDRIRPMSEGRAGVLSDELRGQLRRRKSLRIREKDFGQVRNRARRAMYMVLTDPFVSVVWNQMARQSARLGYEFRTPLYGRRFLEFAFSIPEHLRLRGETFKTTHLHGLDGYLPDSVVNRTTKADFGMPFLRQLVEPQGRLAELLLAPVSGHVLGEEVRRFHKELSGKPESGALIWQLWTIAELEGIFGV